MTPVPVVSTPLNTRTVREVCDNYFADGSHRECLHCDRRGTVGRLVADPVFVVLPEVPDLTGSPVYAATWQQRVAMPGESWFPWRDELEGDRERALTVLRSERRQLVEWRARRVEPLPVFRERSLPGWKTDRGPYIAISDPRTCPVGQVATVLTWRNTISPSYYIDRDATHALPAKPWAQNLQPGMCVLRLSDWEHLEQPYTKMTCWACEGSGDGDWCPGAGFEPCLECRGSHGVVPLSVPDGVLSWIELA